MESSPSDGYSDEMLVRNVVSSSPHLSHLAGVEDQLGHHARAIELTTDALRFAYVAMDPAVIGPGHHDMAVLLGRVDNSSPQVLAHYLASAIIAHRTGAETLSAEIEVLAMFAFAHGLPGRIALDDICTLAEQTSGVRLRDLLARLPQRVPDELQQLADSVLRRAHETMEDWRPLMTAVVLRATGRADAGLAEELEIRLAGLEQNAGSAPMAGALRRVLAGERGPELLDGLGLLPFGIVKKVLDALSEPVPGGS